MNKTLINSLVKNEENKLIKEIALIIGAVIFLIAFSQVRIQLPYTPVPITGQTFAVILIGLLYNRKQSFAVLLIYVILGSLNVPVFSGFKSGIIFNLATGGYVLGFFIATQVLGYFAENGLSKSYTTLIIAIVIANILIYFVGLVQLSIFIKPDSLMKLLNIGMIPFIPGDILKMALAVAILPNAWKLVK